MTAVGAERKLTSALPGFRLCPEAAARCIPASNDTIRELVKAVRRHLDAMTLEKIVNELLDSAAGNRSF
jgi:hypothetical protein